MILQESSNPTAGDSSRGHLVPTYYVQTFHACDPDGPIVGGDHGSHRPCREPFARGKRDNRTIAEAVETFRRSQPHIAFPILKEALHDVARKAVFATEMIHSLAEHSVDAIA